MIRNQRGVAAGIAIVTAAWLVAAGCGRNGGELPSDVTLAGYAGENRLLVQVAPGSSLTGESTAVVYASVFDQTNATGYALYRSVDGITYELAVPYPGEQSGTLNQGAEIFNFIDRTAPFGPMLYYQARGVIQGEETTASPLTNVAVIPATSNPAELYAFPFDLIAPIEQVRTDSLPVFEWEAVPGADRYTLQIVRADLRTFFTALTPEGGAHTYQYGSGAGSVVQYRPLTLSTYVWGVQAVDLGSRIIAVTPFDFFKVDTTGFGLPGPDRLGDAAALTTLAPAPLFGAHTER